MSGNNVVTNNIERGIDEALAKIGEADASFVDVATALDKTRSLLQLLDDFNEVFCRGSQNAESRSVEDCVMPAVSKWLRMVEQSQGRAAAASMELAVSLVLSSDVFANNRLRQTKLQGFVDPEMGAQMLGDSPSEEQLEAFALGTLCALVRDRLERVKTASTLDCYVRNATEVVWLQREFDARYESGDDACVGILEESGSVYLSYEDGLELARAVAEAMHCRVEVLSGRQMKLTGRRVNISHARSLYIVLVRAGYDLELLRPRPGLDLGGYPPKIFAAGLAAVIDYACRLLEGDACVAATLR